MNEVKNSWEVQTAALNLQILERRVNAFNAIKTIREGDYVRHLSGKEEVVVFFTGDWYQLRPVFIVWLMKDLSNSSVIVIIQEQMAPFNPELVA